MKINTGECAVDKYFREIGERISQARKSKCILQERLAEITGLSKLYIYKIEAGYNHITVRTLLKIAEALDVSIADILSDGPEFEFDLRIQIFLKKHSEKEVEFFYHMLNQYEQARELYLKDS